MNTEQYGRSIIVLGAGGHAAVVIEIARGCGYEPVAIYDDNDSAIGRVIAGVAVRGRISDLPDDLVGHACIAIGNNQVRKKIAERLRALTWPILVHQNACVSPLAVTGPGTVVCAGAVVQPMARIGSFAIINVGACIDHDSSVGDFCHIAIHACLGTSSEIGEGVHVGIGAIVKAFSRVEPWSAIAPGNLV
ncbi:MAG: transferase [Candidatus Riflebacteria bacterium]|nr:transferase [Candidatus Riflebacteria bacterium]